jgi:hypothetical protein
VSSGFNLPYPICMGQLAGIGIVMNPQKKCGKYGVQT